jgi:hypothetical protein
MEVVSISSITSPVKNAKVEDGTKNMVAAVLAAVHLDHLAIIDKI